VTRQRSAALHASDLGLTEPAQVVRVAVGSSVLVDLQQALIEAHQNVTRFPVLYYFHPDQPEESMNRLLRAGIVVCLVLRWGVRQDDQRIPVVWVRPWRRLYGASSMTPTPTTSAVGPAVAGSQLRWTLPRPLSAWIGSEPRSTRPCQACGRPARRCPRSSPRSSPGPDARLARLAREHGFEDQALLGA
jgi:hypothetical protein